MSKHPNIKILATGGTIAGAGESAVAGAYKAGKLPIEALLEAVPQTRRIAELSGEQIASIGGQAMTPEIWLRLARRVNELLASNAVDGIVITHGTDTMEETAYFLHLTVHSDKPVVLVGAMRPATAMSADGPANLYNAVTLAASPMAKGKGVLVTMNETILSARDVTKTNTTTVTAFQAPGRGPLGAVAHGKAHFSALPGRTHTHQTEFQIDALAALPSVDILYGYAGDNSAQVEATVQAGAAGLVFAGVGNGNLNPMVEQALAKARQQGIVVVRSSRIGNGRVTLDAEVDDARYGFVVADDLNPQQARILLLLALTQTRDPQTIQEMFFKY